MFFLSVLFNSCNRCYLAHKHVPFIVDENTVRDNGFIQMSTERIQIKHVHLEQWRHKVLYKVLMYNDANIKDWEFEQMTRCHSTLAVFRQSVATGGGSDEHNQILTRQRDRELTDWSA